MAVNNLANYTSADGLGFPLNFRRGNPNPLDNSSVWSSLSAAQTYAQSDPTAYVGQVLTVVDAAEGTAIAYAIQDEAGTLERIGTVTLGDDKSITKNEDNTLSLVGFAAAATNAQPYKKADGTVGWAVPDTSTVSGLQTAVANLQTDVSDLQTDVAANTAAIEVLNGSKTTKGSVAYQIAEIVAGAPEAYDTLKELADWIATHGTEAAAMNTAITENTEAITALEGLVGNTAVATQIANALDAALKVGEGEAKVDKYALATELTAIATRMTQAETDIDDLQTLVGATSVASQIEAALKVDGADKYALKSHTHAIGDVTGLSAALDGKATNETVNGLITRFNTILGDESNTTPVDTRISTALSTALGDLSDKTVKDYVDSSIADGNFATKTELTTHTTDTTVHITSAERTSWTSAKTIADKLDGAVTVEGSVKKQISDAKTELTTEINKKLDASAVTGDLLTHNASEFATAAQGAKADSAVQSVTVLGTTLTNGSELTTAAAKTALGLGTMAYETASNYVPRSLTSDVTIDAATHNLYISAPSTSSSITLATVSGSIALTADVGGSIDISADSLGSVGIDGGSVTIGATDKTNSVTIKKLVAPTLDSDAATKKYVDDNIPVNVSELVNDMGYLTKESEYGSYINYGDGYEVNISATNNVNIISGRTISINGQNAIVFKASASEVSADFSGKRATNLSDPTNNSDAANKSYVDTKASAAQTYAAGLL